MLPGQGLSAAAVPATGETLWQRTENNTFMSREQRRNDNRQTGRPAASNRRTPQRVKTESGLPTMPLAILGGVVLIAGLLAFLIWQASSGGDTLSGADAAEQDDSADLPGAFFPSQGRGHFEGGLIGHEYTPFCEGVEQSELADERTGSNYGETPGAETSETPEATTTPTVTPTTDPSHGTPNLTPTVPGNCYASNPPSSGRHLGVQRNIDIGGGRIINIPPDPDVYPHDVEIPRDAIPHALEHAGVFVGWNCAEGDQACLDIVQQVEDLTNDRIDNHDDRVVMSIDLDLPVGTIGLAGWTRALVIPYSEYDEGVVEDFISTHSCRFDPEGFC
jgi:hypothetical protein